MANRTISMHKVQDIIKLFSGGYSHRRISKITGVHRNVIRSYLSFIKDHAVSLEEAVLLTEEELLNLFKKDRETVPLSRKQGYFEEFLPYAKKEINRKHVTRQLLYQEYTAKYAQVYSYSHFCELFSASLQKQDYSLFQTFGPGEIMMADFAGDKLSYTDKSTGEEISCQVLVVTLGYSGYTFVYALASQSQECFIEGLNKALEYFKGSPSIVRFDNLKAGVIKSDRYEPSFNTLLSMFCEHNSLVADATRAGKPKDKAQVESHVNIVYKRIYAPLRDQSCYSLSELNASIVQHLDAHNKRPYRGSSKSRLDFYQEEAAFLKPLPNHVFRRKYTKTAIVQKNYHIWLGQDEHYYSIPYQYTGKEILVVYDSETVEVYYQHTRIAIHKRMEKIGRYSTIRDHMPAEHTIVQDGINPALLRKQASGIGEHAGTFADKLLNKGLLTPQHFKSCQGLISLGRKYPKERVNRACKRALDHNSITYKSVLTILEKNLDSLDQEDKQVPIPFNHNSRGAQSFT